MKAIVQRYAHTGPDRSGLPKSGSNFPSLSGIIARAILGLWAVGAAQALVTVAALMAGMRRRLRIVTV